MLERHMIAWIIAALFVAAAIVVSVQLIQRHIRCFVAPEQQSKIIGILWMVPIYGMDSWLSLRFKDAAIYLDLARDCYEAYVIYLFLALMIAYLGEDAPEGELKVVAMLDRMPPMRHPFPLGYCRPPIQLNAQFLRDVKRSVMAFVVLKPTLALLAMILHARGLYDQGQFTLRNGYPYIAFVMNIAITYAFYNLVLFYLALRKPLARYSPMPKFLCIKAVLFLSFWQGVMVAGLQRIEVIHEAGAWSVENVATGIQNLLLCFEMFLAALAHRYAFPATPYERRAARDPSLLKGGPRALRTGLLRDHLAIDSAIRDFNQVMPVVLPSSFKPGNPTVLEHGSAGYEGPEERVRRLQQRAAGTSGGAGAAGTKSGGSGARVYKAAPAAANPAAADGTAALVVSNSGASMAAEYYDEL